MFNNEDIIYSYGEDVLEVLGVKPPKDELMFGLELESMETDCFPLQFTNAGIWKADNSCWAEYVTKPMSYDDLVAWARSAPLETIVPHEDCGMHLHINRGALTQREACYLALLLSDEDYASELTLRAGRTSNGYCRKVKKGDEGRSRYEAVNLTNSRRNKNTVEIRIFASTNDADVLVERLNWVMSLITFVKSPFASDRYADYLEWKWAGSPTEMSKWDKLKRFMTKERHLPNPLSRFDAATQDLIVWSAGFVAFGGCVLGGIAGYAIGAQHLYYSGSDVRLPGINYEYLEYRRDQR